MRKILNMMSIMIIVVLMIMYAFGACSATSVKADSGQTNPIKIWFQNENGYMHTYNVVDEKTGVHYIVVARHGGGVTGAITMSPRYNADGTLYT